jgi:hypothetical protein
VLLRWALNELLFALVEHAQRHDIPSSAFADYARALKYVATLPKWLQPTAESQVPAHLRTSGYVGGSTGSPARDAAAEALAALDEGDADA